VNLVVTGIVGVISIDLLYVWYRNSYNKSLLNGSSRRYVSSSAYNHRAFKKILLSDKYQTFYYVVCGEPGTGKTTLIRIASREVKQDKRKDIQGECGVIYVDVSTDVKEFGKNFEKLLILHLRDVLP